MTRNQTDCLPPAQAAHVLSRIGLSICDLSTRLSVRSARNICIFAVYWRASGRRGARHFREI
jgi:hypothetical protein